MAIITGVTFKENGKVYYFDPGDLTPQKGDLVIVETARGLECAQVVMDKHEVSEAELVAPLRKVVRLGTEDDKRRAEENKAKEARAFSLCEQRIAQHGLDMHLVEAEYSFDGSKIVFFFTADGRVDFRALVRDLASVFKTRIELRQIGVRDEVKLIGGLGPCGREVCCRSFLPDFAPVSIRMAKDQNLSLNPVKISGICGRLMCCLGYEENCYQDVLKRCPKKGATVKTPKGTGTVSDIEVLKERVKVRIPVPGEDSYEYSHFYVDELGDNPTRSRSERSQQESDEENMEYLMPSVVLHSTANGEAEMPVQSAERAAAQPEAAKQSPPVPARERNSSGRRDGRQFQGRNSKRRDTPQQSAPGTQQPRPARKDAPAPAAQQGSAPRDTASPAPDTQSNRAKHTGYGNRRGMRHFESRPHNRPQSTEPKSGE